MNPELEALRAKILAIDHEMIVLLAKRLDYACQIGQIKKQENLSFEDTDYFQLSLKIKQSFGQNFGLNPEEIKLFFELLQDLSINRMKKDVSL
jgi:chorismate mutase